MPILIFNFRLIVTLIGSVTLSVAPVSLDISFLLAIFLSQGKLRNSIRSPLPPPKLITSLWLLVVVNSNGFVMSFMISRFHDILLLLYIAIMSVPCILLPTLCFMNIQRISRLITISFMTNSYTTTLLLPTFLLLCIAYQHSH